MNYSPKFFDPYCLQEYYIIYIDYFNNHPDFKEYFPNFFFFLKQLKIHKLKSRHLHREINRQGLRFHYLYD